MSEEYPPFKSLYELLTPGELDDTEKFREKLVDEMIPNKLKDSHKIYKEKNTQSRSKLKKTEIDQIEKAIDQINNVIDRAMAVASHQIQYPSYREWKAYPLPQFKIQGLIIQKIGPK